MGVFRQKCCGGMKRIVFYVFELRGCLAISLGNRFIIIKVWHLSYESALLKNASPLLHKLGYILRWWSKLNLAFVKDDGWSFHWGSEISKWWSLLEIGDYTHDLSDPFPAVVGALKWPGHVMYSMWAASWNRKLFTVAQILCTEHRLH